MSMKNVDLKVGLYIQEFEPSNKKECEKVKNQFYKTIENVRDSDIDLLVFPETSFRPDDFPSTDVKEIATEISKMVGRAVIVGFRTSNYNALIKRVNRELLYIISIFLQKGLLLKLMIMGLILMNIFPLSISKVSNSV